MSVRMTSAGDYGWLSDAQGLPLCRGPPTARPAAIPSDVLTTGMTDRIGAPAGFLLIKLLRVGLLKWVAFRTGNETIFRWPVVSISLGRRDCARWRAKTRRQAQTAFGCNQDVVVSGRRGAPEPSRQSTAIDVASDLALDDIISTIRLLSLRARLRTLLAQGRRINNSTLSRIYIIAQHRRPVAVETGWFRAAPAGRGRGARL